MCDFYIDSQLQDETNLDQSRADITSDNPYHGELKMSS